MASPVKKPISEKRAAALARGREKQKLLREQKKNETLEKMKKELWENFQKEREPSSSSSAKEPRETERAKEPLEHIKKMKDSLSKSEVKHIGTGLFGTSELRTFWK